MASVIQQTPEADKYSQQPQAVENQMSPQNKFGSVMGEFKTGNLKSGAGNIVTNPKQAKAIAVSEQGRIQGARERKMRTQ